MVYNETFIVTVYNTNGTKGESYFHNIGEVMVACKEAQKYFEVLCIEKITVDSATTYEGRRRYKTFYADNRVE